MAAKKPESRDNAGRFVKGKSGNPGGKKPMDPKTKKALEAAAPEAAEALANMLKDEKLPPNIKVKVCEVILDRVR